MTTGDKAPAKPEPVVERSSAVERAESPKDLPKVKSSVPPQWLLEVHFKHIDGHVFLVIHPPKKPQFPLYQGVLFNGVVCADELVQALKEARG